MNIIMAGLDPSLDNLGMAKGTLDLQSGVLSSIELQLNVTKPDNKNKQVRKNSIDLERARSHYTALTSFLEGVDLVSVEIPVGSQSARSMASYGICIGLLASIQIPFIQVTATEVKLAGYGNKSATKKQMIEWATTTYPDINWLKHGGKFTNANEHLADAVGAIYAGVRTNEFKLLRMSKME